MSTSHYLYEKAESEIKALKAEIKRLRGELEWYATANYALDISQESMETYQKRVYNDGGRRARAALEGT